LSVVRLMRILRVIGRMTRVLRVISIAEKLVLLVESFIQGMKSAFWVMLLLLLAIYVFAVLGLALFGGDDAKELQMALDKATNTSDAPQVDLKRLFGTIPRTLVTMVQFYNDDGGVSMIQKPIGNIWPAAWIYFLLFFMIVNFGMIPLLSAVFVDSLMETRNEQLEKVKHEQQRLHETLAKVVDGMFEVFDDDKDGRLNRADCERGLAFIKSPELKELLETLEMNESMLASAVELSLLDDDYVSKDEFVNSLCAQVEPPQRADIFELNQRVQKSQRTLNNRVNKLQSALRNVRGTQDRITQALVRLLDNRRLQTITWDQL